METDEAFELLLAVGLRFPGFEDMARRQMAVLQFELSCTDGTRDAQWLDLSCGIVAALAEESGYLHVCTSAPEVEVIAARHVLDAKQQGDDVACFGRAIRRAVALIEARLGRRWHERAYLSN